MKKKSHMASGKTFLDTDVMSEDVNCLEPDRTEKVNLTSTQVLIKRICIYKKHGSHFKSSIKIVRLHVVKWIQSKVLKNKSAVIKAAFEEEDSTGVMQEKEG